MTSANQHRQKYPCGRIQRRAFLQDAGRGLAAIALGSLLGGPAARGADAPTNGAAGDANGPSGPHSEGEWRPPSGRPHFAAKAKSVIWFFMLGGTSHLESFDPKPELDKYAGKTVEQSPYKNVVLDSPYYRKNVRDFAGTPRALMATLYPTQIKFQKRGQSGLEISDWWPHLATRADDLAIVRSMWTTDNDHAAQLQFHTGRHIFDGFFPSIGSWVHYGLGSLNENLPQFIVLGGGPGDCCGGVGAHDGSYLGPEHSGCPLTLDPANPLPFGTPGANVSIEERRGQLDLLRQLNGMAAAEYPHDANLQARVKSYELAFRMQMSLPGIVKLSDETAATQAAYGLNDPGCQTMARNCLAARRLVEQGVRFIQIYDDGWDAHSQLVANHSKRTKAVDQPIAALLHDLKQRGLLDETLVVWATEFGRTPGAERSDGRDHHPYGFSIWMAGGGVKGGVVHGATDEIGFHAVEHRHYVTDVHATVLHQLGLNPHRMELPGHKRLEIDFGRPIREILV